MSNILKYVTADVFTSSAYGGNPLAVVLNGEHLSDAQMQAVAREFNYSETTFILPPQNSKHAARVRIFTPAHEMMFAGHPTVGTAWAMAHLGLIQHSGTTASIVLEEGVGPIPVTIRFDAGKPSAVTFTTAVVPAVLAAPPSNEVLAAILGLEVGDISSKTPALALSCGAAFTCVPMRSVEAVARANLDIALWRTHLAAHEAHKVFVFARAEPGVIHARMFAPGSGVAEDPATGSAACAVTGRLVRDDGLSNGTGRWTIHQGIEMGRPSRIDIEADVVQAKITAVRCGGAAVMMAEGTIRAPD